MADLAELCMIFIYLFTAIGFPPGGSGRQTCTKQETDSMYKRRNNT